MREFQVRLVGFFEETRFAIQIKASDRAHAFRIAAAIFNDCFKRAEVKEV